MTFLARRSIPIRCANRVSVEHSRAWRSTLINRQRKFLPLKLYVGLGVFVVVVLGAFALGAPIGYWYMLSALLITVVVSWVAPWIESRTGK